MSEQPHSGDPVNTGSGHLAVRVEGLHAREPQFQFEHPQSGIGVGASIVAHLVFFGLAVLVVLYAPEPKVTAPVFAERANESIIWLTEPGPGGGGGGGGNEMKAPPRETELPGKEKITVPVERPKVIEPPKIEEPVVDQALNIPAKTIGDADLVQPGVLDSSLGASTESQGSGRGGGAGTGEGTGLGPGRGSGLGPGEGGGTGGGVYRPGNGVELPRVIREVKPQYTADAMRAKVQGTVWLDCVVRPDGTVGDVKVTKSLDPVFGLDQEAIKAARQWRFVPGTRFGQPVNVLVTIELTFTLR